MVAYSLECTVCGACEFSRNDWLSHLLQPRHQDGAQRTTWDDKKVVESSLVVFTTFPVMSLEFLQFLSTTEYIVVDFVWRSDRPEVGIAQFESRKAVKKVYSQLDGPNITVTGKFAQLRKASDCHHLEWLNLVPNQKDRLDIPNFELALSNGNHSNTEEQSSCGPCHQVDLQSSLNSNPEADLGLATKTTRNLTDQFELIRAKIEIPLSVYQRTAEIGRILCEGFQQHFPSCDMFMVKHWALRVKNWERRQDWPTFHFNHTEGEDNAGSNLLHFFSKHGLDVLQFSANFVKPGEDIRATRIGNMIRGTHKSFSIRLSFERYHSVQVTTGVMYLIEAETYRLIQFLLSFDPRARSLLVLSLYWKKFNGIELLRMTKLSKGDIMVVPHTEITGVALLITFFLGFQKIIPTAKQLMEQAHPPKFANGVDIGFACDESFRSEWLEKNSSSVPLEGSNEFVISVLELAVEFFTFCGNLPFNNWILNARDGETIIRSALEQSKGLSSDESAEVRNTLKGNREGLVKGRSVFFLHPLLVTSVYAMSHLEYVGKVCPIMRRCASSWNKLIADCKTNNWVNFNLSEFLTLSHDVLQGYKSSESDERVKKTRYT